MAEPGPDSMSVLPENPCSSPSFSPISINGSTASQAEIPNAAILVPPLTHPISVAGLPGPAHGNRQSLQFPTVISRSQFSLCIFSADPGGTLPTQFSPKLVTYIPEVGRKTGSFFSRLGNRA